MNLTPYQKRQLGIFLALIVGIPLTIFAVYQGIQLILRASSEASPTDVVVTNLTTNSLTVTWFTDVASDGYVVPVLNGAEQSPVRDKRGSGKRSSHYVELKSLEPNTSYSFVIYSGGKKYTKDGTVNYEFTTASVGNDTPIPNPVHGSVTGVSNDDVVVYIFPKNKSTYPVSTTIPSGGNWIVDLSSLRKISDKSLLKVTSDTELVLLAKNTSGKGAVLEGTYSALFDSNGKLNQTLALEIEESDDLLSYFPDESKLSSTPTVETPTTPEKPTTPTKPTVPTTPTTPSVPEGDDDTNTNTEYQIVHDLKWIDIVTNDGQGSFESGESTVLVTNLTDVGFSVLWRSPSKVEGYVKYGTSKSNLSEEVWDVRDGLTSKNTYYSHIVESKRLEPETTYYFEIYSGTEKYNKSGAMYTVTTYSTLTTPPPFETKSGSVSNTSTPAEWIVVAKILDEDDAGTAGNSGYISTVPDDNGNWILTIGDARSEDGSSYFTFSNSDILSIYLLGASTKKFDNPISMSEVGLDVSKVGSTTITKVKLLSDYGIVNIK